MCVCVCLCVCVESKSAARVAAVFVDFPKNRCNFLLKNPARNRTAFPPVSLIASGRVQFLTGSFVLLGYSPPLPCGSGAYGVAGVCVCACVRVHIRSACHRRLPVCCVQSRDGETLCAVCRCSICVVFRTSWKHRLRTMPSATS